jgi:hypothetical protein
LPANGYLLLVNFDPSDTSLLTAFRARYNLNPSLPVFGPYAGNLNNSGETIELYRPDPPQSALHPDAGFVPHILVEKVNYSATAPWPAGADGTGSSLQRSVASHYANDPANWFVAAPTAGRDNTLNQDDTNGDGLPDSWQIQFFGSITAPQAAPGADPDGDGFNNLQEYLAGTDPTSNGSYLKIDFVEAVDSARSIHFNAIAGKTYTILYQDSLDSATWQRLTNVPPQSASGIITISDPIPAPAARFYILVTPQLP